MSILPFCFLFLSLSVTFGANAVSLLFSDIDKFYKFFHIGAETLDVFIDLYDEFSDNPLHVNRNERRMLEHMNKITTLIQRVETNIPQVTIAKLEQMEHDFKDFIRFENGLNSLTQEVGRIEGSYEIFLSLKAKLMNKMDNSTGGKDLAVKNTMKDYANSVITMVGESVRTSLSAIHDMIDVRPGSSILSKKDLFTLILNNFNGMKDSRCIIDKSPQQLIFDTLTSLRLTQMKGLVVTEYAYVILRLYDGADYRDFMSEFKDLMLKRFDKQGDIAMNAIRRADNSYWKCDPPQHIPEKTYTEVTRLLQGYIHNEKELSSKGSCTAGCEAYSSENDPHCNYNDRLCRSHPRCTGRVHDCKLVKEDMSICFASAKSTRRYNFIKWSGGSNFGDTSQSCEEYSYFEKYRQLLIFKCFYCFCLCDEDVDSDRYFSLEEMTSDIEKNMVVIGVRFAKKNRTIHLRIKQAKLLPLGIIDNASMSWVDLPTILPNSRLTNQSKYHKMSYESREFDLDDLMAPEKYLITGVRMRTIGSHLNVEVRLTGFEFSSGQLYQNQTYWKGNDNTDATASVTKRKKHNLDDKRRLPTDIIGESVLRSMPDSRTDTFVQFQPSDEYTDAAQSMVPFIDIQPVVPSPPIPLVGLGIIHKGAMASGGFIEPKVYTLSLAEYSLAKEGAAADHPRTTTEADK